uniref:Phospholipase B-like n=1 Tax=Romanomermis culicivorax TaxID=13658 RepID=A0A915IWP2_ROMCU
WSFLEIETFETYDDKLQAYSAGFGEGFVTKKLIEWHWNNLISGRFECKNQISDFCQNLYRTMLGDFTDLSILLNLPVNVTKALFDGEHCSGLIVPLPGNKDILFGHVSWFPYETMLRVQKLYKFAYSRNGRKDSSRVASTGISMSSYPGFLWSYDDFYLLESGLSVMETTIGGDGALWPYVMRNNTVPTWIRILVSNRLATNGSGYNNQYMILDYKKFSPGKPLPDTGLLHLVEQVPYFDNVYNYTASWLRYRQYGDWFSYEKCPRARIFQRDTKNVTDFESMVYLMRSNNYMSDPLSLCENCIPKHNAMNAVSARGDLNLKNGTYPFWQLQHSLFGGTDLKVTNYSMFQKLRFYAISGPVYNAEIPSFQWSKYDKTHLRHEGHPDVFKFKSVINKWNFFVA